MPCLLVAWNTCRGQSCYLPGVSLIRVLYSVIFPLLCEKYQSRGDTSPEHFYSTSLPIQALLSIHTWNTVYGTIKDIYYVTHYWSLSCTLQHIKQTLIQPMKEHWAHSWPVSSSPPPPQTAKPGKKKKHRGRNYEVNVTLGTCINLRIQIIFSYEVVTLQNLFCMYLSWWQKAADRSPECCGKHIAIMHQCSGQDKLADSLSACPRQGLQQWSDTDSESLIPLIQEFHALQQNSNRKSFKFTISGHKMQECYNGVREHDTKENYSNYIMV
jgi:hypothetical protein